MWPWREKQPDEPAPTPQSNSFFSTEGVIALRENPAKRLKRMQGLMALTFHRTIDDLKPIDQDGNAIATDNADLPSVKLRNGLGLGGYIPETQFAWYCGQGFIGYQAAALLSQNWLVKKACAMPAKDASRNGYELSINDGTEVETEVLDYIREQDKKFEILRNCVELIDLGRTFGIRLALFEVDSSDPDYYTKPFNPDGVKPGSYKGISQIDPYWITPELGGDAAANPGARDFYEPTWWRINGKRVHRTHLVIFRNGNLPDILKPAYLYGGMPVPQLISERVYAAERTANEAPMLAMTKRLTVLKCDITQAVANPEAFNERMTLWTQLMNNFGVKIIGESDEVQQYDTSLADLDAAIMTQYQLVAAASGVPATKLLGTSPKGFNATGEFEESSYHEELESIQQHDLSPLVNRHHLLLIRSHVAKKFKIKPFNTEVAWKPVDSPTAAEQAEINLKKAQTDAQLSQAGAIDGTDIRGRLINDLDSGYNGIEEIVPNGPGDREYEQELLEQASGSEESPDESQTAE
jgi:phage-related protein (TIGR01555 family)